MSKIKRIPKKAVRYAALCLCISLLALTMFSCSSEDPDKVHNKMGLLELDESEFNKYIKLGQYKDLNIEIAEGESRPAAVWRAVEYTSEITEYPISHVYYYRDQLIAQYKYYAEQAGVSYDAMLSELGESEVTILEEAKKLTRSDLVYAAVVRAEGIALTEDEKIDLFDKYVDKYVEEYGYTADYVRAEMADEIYGSMLYDKTTEFLLISNSFVECN